MADEKQLVNVWRMDNLDLLQHLKNLKEAKLDLKGAKLRGVKLQEANLKEANFQGADLREADLYGANLQRADLHKADLYGANLQEANLQGANLRETNLQDADLRGANLYYIKIDPKTMNQIPEEIREKYRNEWIISDDNLITRSIEFPPEYHQAGISILNYFSTVLKKKYPDIKATVQIKQEDLKVTMTIDPVEGDREVIEKALDEYGLVVTGKMTPEEFTDDKLLKIELEGKLNQAKMEVENQKLLLQYQEEQLKKKDIRIDRFLDVVEAGLSRPVNINTGDSIDIDSDGNVSVAKNQSAITNGKVGDIKINE